MEWLQTLLDNSTTPALTAFLLGLLTAVSPCPLATNIAAIGFIGKDIENRRRIFRNGLLYTLGRVVAYTVLGIVLILVLREGSSLFGIQKFIGKYGELILGPALCCASACSCCSAANSNYPLSASKETEKTWLAKAAGEPFCSECCSQWHFVRQAACSISAC